MFFVRSGAEDVFSQLRKVPDSGESLNDSSQARILLSSLLATGGRAALRGENNNNKAQMKTTKKTSHAFCYPRRHDGSYPAVACAGHHTSFWGPLGGFQPRFPPAVASRPLLSALTATIWVNPGRPSELRVRAAQSGTRGAGRG